MEFVVLVWFILGIVFSLFSGDGISVVRQTILLPICATAVFVGSSNELKVVLLQINGNSYGSCFWNMLIIVAYGNHLPL
jgi:hypothetical protein